MGHKISSIVTTFVTLLAFILLVAFISSDTQLDDSRKLVTEFTETVQYKGYITYDQYMSLVDSIPYKNCKVQLTHFKRDNDTTGKTKGALDMVFTDQIMGNATVAPTGDIKGTLLYTNNAKPEYSNIYVMEVGDQIQVDLIVTEGTFFDTIVGTLSGRGTPAMKKVASASGVIVNAQYSTADKG